MKMDKETTIKEVLKCGKDPLYFLNNYAKISHPMKGQIPFDTYDFQDDLIRNFKDHRFNIILKARQLGISTITAGYVVWMMMFHRDKNILVMATKFTTASNLVKKVKTIMKNIPPWLQISRISIDNRTSFELSNGSQIKASSTSADAGRSEALSLLVLDEAAHIEELSDLWPGLYPTLSTGGRCIALSSPNGVGNWFHKSYVDSEQGNNDFRPTKLMWDIHPDRDKEWFKKETKNMSRRQIAQELECNFNMSGETVIHGDDIEKALKKVREPERRVGFDRNLHIWEEYDHSKTYLLVADVARGDGKDYSAFHLLNITDMSQAAEYQGKIDLDMYADFLIDAAGQYGNPMLAVENNNIGYAVLTKLIDREYPNLYYSTKSSNDYVDPFLAQSISNSIPGFTTSMKSRPLIIAKLEEFIRNGVIEIRSTRLINELKTFIWNHGKPEAMRGYNDDLIISMAIACWIRDTALVENQRDLEYKKAFLNSITTTNRVLDTSIPGMDGYSGGSSRFREDKKKEMEDLMWLYKG